jgi:hypothetical protein
MKRMCDEPSPERRKNPARKKQIDLVYQVIWNAERRSFDVIRAGDPTGSFARDRTTAIGLAIRDAEKDAKQGLKVVVYSRLDGRQNIEWSS